MFQWHVALYSVGSASLILAIIFTIHYFTYIPPGHGKPDESPPPAETPSRFTALFDDQERE